ncbi:hypothetical protein C8R32_104238 [Nitrosospira sp. Nsp5]|uniref:Uncharacterized protein n=1 Tax=Nitrosospira multiformis TaxID=1231 RepID=A0ABY0TEV3_9PROT|nr:MULTISPECIES: hypothetical protein [Nitrosospira]PTR09159.1 hypothetical protein C8R32_104238 [Nitrosospira sp. Nsp5]SDQ72273.1 hypothetical protein SAMN05216402_2017 [Nitrosospira multiformis]
MTGASKVNKADDANSVPDKNGQQPHRVHLPGFITGDEIGLGDAIKRTSSYLGIQPCGDCERRAAKLNRWLVFTPRRSR